MGIRSMLRKVFGRDREESPATSVPPQTRETPETSTPETPEARVTPDAPATPEAAARRAADDLVAASFDNPHIPKARTADPEGAVAAPAAQPEEPQAEATAPTEPETAAPEEQEETEPEAAADDTTPAEPEADTAAEPQAEADAPAAEPETAVAAADPAEPETAVTVDADASEAAPEAQGEPEPEPEAPVEPEAAAVADADASEATAEPEAAVADDTTPAEPEADTADEPQAEATAPAAEPETAVAADADASEATAEPEAVAVAVADDATPAEPEADTAAEPQAEADAPADEPEAAADADADPSEATAEPEAAAVADDTTPAEPEADTADEPQAEATAPAAEPEAQPVEVQADDAPAAGAEAVPALSLAAVKAAAPHLADAYKAAGAQLKKQGLTGARAAVYLVVDRSGSMRGYFKDGSVQRLAEQVTALAAHLDETAAVTTVFFSTDIDGTVDLAPADLTPTRVEEINGTLGRLGRTNYHRAVEEVLAHHEKNDPNRPALVVFQTDGAPESKTAATQALAEAADRPLHWRFVAWGEEDNKAFDFLRKLDGTPRTATYFAGLTPVETAHAAFYRGLLAGLEF
ncbi:VWA domain-containing protein [Streptomyces tanashiensis]|uniref:VWA domain-containing protein n=1 Tax=Streptomyces tanashiensis TaxID=67367 RepID=UPI0036E7498A